MIKKILSCMLCMLMLFTCVACSNTNASASKAYVFSYNGAEIAIDDELDGVLAALGSYDRHETSPSCNHDGDAHFYYYGTKIELESYPKNGKDLLYKITLFDDTVKTAEGIRIGDTKDAVIKAYGDAAEEKGTALRYRAGDMYLQFNFTKDGLVSQIQYLHPDAVKAS